MNEIYHCSHFSLALFPWQPDLPHTGHALPLTLEGTQNMAPTWGGQMSQIKQNDTGAGATVCLVMCKHSGGVSLRARFLDLFEEETLMPFTILVSGG